VNQESVYTIFVSVQTFQSEVIAFKIASALLNYARIASAPQPPLAFLITLPAKPDKNANLDFAFMQAIWVISVPL
ncbi:MAG TPA: hypothetical protein VFE88_04665, partial [Candidatus Nanoarchaeia archaeon]|nr:hypothetical protein [Candidatus Nanoarchaeia archaeon]